MTTTRAAAPASVSGNETTRLYAKYGDQLYRYCVARLRSREDAEDAVQSTFIRVHGALEKGVTPQFEAAWLYKIAHNVCLSRSEVTGRRAQHETPHDFADLERSLAAPEPPRDELLGLSEALGSMPKNLRDPILLREWQGLSYAEIAEALDTSVPAVETLIFRGRRFLAAALAPAPKRRRTLAGLFDAGTAYSGIRVLFAQLRGVLFAAGPAKLAAGAAIVALGGAGLERATVTHAPAQRPAARTPTAQVVTATPIVQVGPPAQRSPATRAAAEPKETTAPARRPARIATTTFPPEAVPVAPPVETPTTVTPPIAPPPTVTVPVVTTTTPTAVPAVPVPTVAPPVDMPGVTVPTVTVAAPTVDTTAVQVPKVEAPVVTLPVVTAPALPVTVPG